MLEIVIMRCQEPEKSGAKRILKKFQPQPELGQQLLQGQGHGDGGQAEGPEGDLEGAIDLNFFQQSS